VVFFCAFDLGTKNSTGTRKNRLSIKKHFLSFEPGFSRSGFEKIGFFHTGSFH